VAIAPRDGQLIPDRDDAAIPVSANRKAKLPPEMAHYALKEADLKNMMPLWGRTCTFRVLAGESQPLLVSIRNSKGTRAITAGATIDLAIDLADIHVLRR
jgi:hypothetical protein